MRVNQVVVLSCFGSAMLGLLVTYAFGGTPYPTEQKGTACFGDPTDTIGCRSAGNQWCETVGEGPACIYCDANDTTEARFCYGTLVTGQKCLNGAPDPMFDCGQSWEGICKKGGSPVHKYCSKGTIVLASDGCKALDVDCTGTQNP
jgi:hypothetical protein